MGMARETLVKNIGKWLNVYHYFSFYRRQIEVFSTVCFIGVCQILHFREKKSTYVLKIPRSSLIGIEIRS